MVKTANPVSRPFVLLALLVFLLLSPLQAAWSQTPPDHDDFPLPKTLTLCGEPVPLENLRVREMLDREFTISVWDRAQVFMWLKRAGRYFPYIEKKLAAAGMPDDLKYLALAESSLIGYIRSHAGAKGYWQFMTRTARHNGLRKDHLVDERLSFEHSTDAAVGYLGELKEMFGSWALAMAAYNCGENRLKKEMKEQRVKEYYRLNLPIETERYVFRIAAIKIIMENASQYGFRIPEERIYKPIACDPVSVKTRADIHLTDLAEALGTDFKVLKELNPQLLDYHLPAGEFTLKVPSGMGEKVSAVIETLTPSGSHRHSGSQYVVKPGDTLHGVAKHTGVSVSRLRELNGIKGSIIRVGQKLRLSP